MVLNRSDETSEHCLVAHEKRGKGKILGIGGDR